jgi:hypothetical protein
MFQVFVEKSLLVEEVPPFPMLLSYFELAM